MQHPKLTPQQEQELQIVLAQIEQRKKDAKVEFFIPTEEQERFFRSKSKQRQVLGANRSGKSEIGHIEAISYCLGYRPFLKRSDPDYFTPFVPPVVGVVTTESFGISGTANLVVGEKFKEFIPKGVLFGEPKKNQQGVPVFYRFRNGSTMHILAYEQDTNKYEGSRFHFAYFDENPPQDKFFAIQRGLTDFGGHYWVTATPIAHPWTYDGLYMNDEVAKFHLGLESNVRHTRKWYNIPKVTGGLAMEDVEDLKSKYRQMHMDEGEMSARLTGKYKHLEGLILSNFDPMVHLVDPFDLPEKCSIYVAIDPHPKKPWCVLFLAVMPNDKMYVTRIMYVKGVIKDIIDSILIELKGRKPQKVIIDPFAVVPDMTTGRSLLTDIREESEKMLIPYTASKDKIRGIQAIRSALHYSIEEGEEPLLYIFSSEKEGIRSLMGWVIDDTGKPSKENDDAGENLYRMMLLRPKYKEPRETGERYSKDFSGAGTTAY